MIATEVLEEKRSLPFTINKQNLYLFPAGPTSVEIVRILISKKLGTNSHNAQLIGSELATNVIEHATPKETPPLFIAGTEQLNEDEAALYFGDNSEKIPVLKGDLLAENGKGMLLVRALSNRWGYTTTIPTEVSDIAPAVRKIVYSITNIRT